MTVLQLKELLVQQLQDVDNIEAINEHTNNPDWMLRYIDETQLDCRRIYKDNWFVVDINEPDIVFHAKRFARWTVQYGLFFIPLQATALMGLMLLSTVWPLSVLLIPLIFSLLPLQLYVSVKQIQAGTLDSLTVQRCDISKQYVPTGTYFMEHGTTMHLYPLDQLRERRLTVDNPMLTDEFITYCISVLPYFKKQTYISSFTQTKAVKSDTGTVDDSEYIRTETKTLGKHVLDQVYSYK